MKNYRWQCIDAGSDYCPCYLAETMDCITCSHLQGKEFCDCNWRGVCIYQAFAFEGDKKKVPREDMEALIVKKEEHGSNITIFTLKVPHYMARQLSQPGSYIFVRNKKLNQYFDAPISIMSTDIRKDLIKIAIEIHGIKTKSIKDVNDSILIRGPYWNGIFGLEYLKQTKDSNSLIIARGIAQAPAMLLINYLLNNNNQIDVIIDEGSSNYNFMKEFYGNENVNIVKECDLYDLEVIDYIDKKIALKNYSLIFVGASNFLQNKLLNNIESLKNKKIVTLNSNEICCGEGICGACTVHDVNGIPIRTCKTQIRDKSL
ncbi:MAG: sulfide/dihydroorotate dehydrogenase-like FAD/NAD-binding protein [Clostridiaceae bacterium]|nr:sulfide/dihydroorotate dehydrogenase-like FAD/NAD-binding protein [Clostridiaceae bacterium]